MPPLVKIPNSSVIRKFILLLFVFTSASGVVWAQNAATVEKLLLDMASPDVAKQVTEATGVPAGSTLQTDANGCLVSFAPWQKGDADHPEGQPQRRPQAEQGRSG